MLLLALLVVAIKGLFVTVAAMMECNLKDTGGHGDNDENEDGVNGVMLLSAALIGGDGDGGCLEETVWRRMTVLGRRKDVKRGGNDYDMDSVHVSACKTENWISFDLGLILGMKGRHYYYR